MDCPTPFKTKYPSQKIALEDVKRIEKKSVRDNVPVREYYCECGSWHISSQPDKFYDKINQFKTQINALLNENRELRKATGVDQMVDARRDAVLDSMRKAIIEKNKTIKKLKQETGVLVAKNIELQRRLDDANKTVNGDA